MLLFPASLRRGAGTPRLFERLPPCLELVRQDVAALFQRVLLCKRLPGVLVGKLFFQLRDRSGKFTSQGILFLFGSAELFDLLPPALLLLLLFGEPGPVAVPLLLPSARRVKRALCFPLVCLGFGDCRVQAARCAERLPASAVREQCLRALQQRLTTPGKSCRKPLDLRVLLPAPRFGAVPLFPRVVHGSLIRRLRRQRRQLRKLLP